MGESWNERPFYQITVSGTDFQDGLYIGQVLEFSVKHCHISVNEYPRDGILCIMLLLEISVHKIVCNFHSVSVQVIGEASTSEEGLLSIDG